MKITASVLFVSTLAITLCAPAQAQQAIITACKPGTGVRLYKHFISLRASGRLKCGSTVEVLRYMWNGQMGQGMVALVRQGTLQGYVQPWHITFSGSQARTTPEPPL